MTNPIFLTIAKALGWTLLHSIWQIALIAIVLKGFLLLCSNQSARLRYGVSFGAMALVLLCSALTFWMSYEPSIVISEGNLLSDAAAMNPMLTGEAIEVTFQTSNWELWIEQLEQYLPYLTFAWILGLLLFAFSTLKGYYQLNQLLQSATEPDAFWQKKLSAFQQQLGITKHVRLAVTAQLEEPITFRHIRPVILLPMSLLSGLTVDQVEVLMLHELAHIRRHDYLLNWGQSILETLFFYHPAFWWMARQVRAEREHCCDDLVLQLYQQPMLYAQTLTQLQLNHYSLTTNLAMSATKDQGVFTTRIHRLFGKYNAPNRQRKGVILTALVAVLFIGVAFYQPNPLEANGLEPILSTVAAIDTTGKPILVAPNTTNPTASEELNQVLGEVLETDSPLNIKYHVDAKLNENGDWVLDTNIIVDLVGEKTDLKTELTEKEKQEIFELAFENLLEDKVAEQPESEFILENTAAKEYDTLVIFNPETFKEELIIKEREEEIEIPNKSTEEADPFVIINPETLEEDVIIVEEPEENKEEIESIPPHTSEKVESVVQAPKIRLGSVKDEKHQPLIVINDETEYKLSKDGYDAKLNALDPNDIESINVLKGKAAIEKYGAQGEDGVVEVYTKDWKRKQRKAARKNATPKLNVFVDVIKETVRFEIDFASNSSGTWLLYDPNGKKLDVDFDDLFAKGNTTSGAITWEWSTKGQPAGIYKTVLKANRKTIERTFEIGPLERKNYDITIESNPEKTSYFFSIELAEAALLQLELFDQAGKSVKSYSKKQVKKGNHAFLLEEAALAAGTYQATFTIDGEKVNRTFDLQRKESIVNRGKASKIDASLQVAPNPVRGQATININVSAKAKVRLEVFDTNGKLVKSFMPRTLEAREVEGNLSFDWQTNEQTPGVYTVMLTVNGVQISKQLVVQ